MSYVWPNTEQVISHIACLKILNTKKKSNRQISSNTEQVVSHGISHITDLTNPTKENKISLTDKNL
jgi:hypothetical protein